MTWPMTGSGPTTLAQNWPQKALGSGQGLGQVGGPGQTPHFICFGRHFTNLCGVQLVAQPGPPTNFAWSFATTAQGFWPGIWTTAQQYRQRSENLDFSFDVLQIRNETEL